MDSSKNKNNPDKDMGKVFGSPEPEDIFYVREYGSSVEKAERDGCNPTVVVKNAEHVFEEDICSLLMFYEYLDIAVPAKMTVSVKTFDLPYLKACPFVLVPGYGYFFFTDTYGATEFTAEILGLSAEARERAKYSAAFERALREWGIRKDLAARLSLACLTYKEQREVLKLTGEDALHVEPRDIGLETTAWTPPGSSYETVAIGYDSVKEALGL